MLTLLSQTRWFQKLEGKLHYFGAKTSLGLKTKEAALNSTLHPHYIWIQLVTFLHTYALAKAESHSEWASQKIKNSLLPVPLQANQVEVIFL